MTDQTQEDKAAEPPLALGQAFAKSICSGHLSTRTTFDLTINGPFSQKDSDVLLNLLSVQFKVIFDE